MTPTPIEPTTADMVERLRRKVACELSRKHGGEWHYVCNVVKSVAGTYPHLEGEELGTAYNEEGNELGNMLAVYAKTSHQKNPIVLKLEELDTQLPDLPEIKNTDPSTRQNILHNAKVFIQICDVESNHIDETLSRYPSYNPYATISFFAQYTLEYNAFAADNLRRRMACQIMKSLQNNVAYPTYMLTDQITELEKLNTRHQQWGIKTAMWEVQSYFSAILKLLQLYHRSSGIDTTKIKYDTVIELFSHQKA